MIDVNRSLTIADVRKQGAMIRRMVSLTITDKTNTYPYRMYVNETLDEMNIDTIDLLTSLLSRNCFRPVNIARLYLFIDCI